MADLVVDDAPLVVPGHLLNIGYLIQFSCFKFCKNFKHFRKEAQFFSIQPNRVFSFYDFLK